MSNKINIYIINGEATTHDDENVKRLAQDIESAVEQYHTREGLDVPKLTTYDKVWLFIQDHDDWQDYSVRQIAALCSISKSSVSLALNKLREEEKIPDDS